MGQKQLKTDRIYVGTVSQVSFLDTADIASGSIVFLCEGTEDDQVPETALRFCSSALLSCSLPELINSLSQIINDERERKDHYRDLLELNNGTHDILKYTAELSGGEVILLNRRRYFSDRARKDPNSWIARRFTEEGKLTDEIFGSLFPLTEIEKSFHSIKVEGERTVYGYTITNGREILGNLILETSTAAEADLYSICSEAAEVLRRCILSEDTEMMDVNTKSVHSFLEAIMNRSLVTRSETRAALDKLPLTVHKYYRAVVVTFLGKDEAVPYYYILGRLKEFFPSSNMAPFGKEIFILLSQEERKFQYQIDEGWNKRLSSFLERYDAVLTVGNATHHTEALASLFRLSKRTGDLAYLLRKDKQRRVFTTEEFIVYGMIDLCAQRFMEDEYNKDVLYLTHPAVTFLTRYDRENETNLRDVLFYYLFNDCNTGKAATALYMHRNTVNNKITLIKKLTELELEAPEIRQRLLLSCQFMRYYEIVLKKEMQ